MVVQMGEERPFSMVYPATGPQYAAGATWFINNESVEVMDVTYEKFGLPRVISPTDVSRVGEYEGVGIYAETGVEGAPEIVYVPVRPGCEFQPYQQEAEIGEVRG